VIDRITGAVLLVSITGVFRFVALPLDVDVGSITGGIMVYCLTYCVYRSPLTTTILRSREGAILTILVLIWPLLTLSYAPAIDWRSVGLTLHTLLLILTAAVYTLRSGWRRVRMLAGLAILVSLGGFLLTWILPGLFEAMADLAGGRSSYQGRAFGFFMQPNKAAAALCVLFIFWLARPETTSLRHSFLNSLLLMAVVAPTGSRGVLVICLCVCGLYLWFASREDSRSPGRPQSRTVRVLQLLTLSPTLVLLLLLAFSTAGNLLLLSDSFRTQGLGSRLLFYTETRLIDTVRHEQSFSVRLRAQQDYLKSIASQPILGQGLGATEYRRNQGEISISSHNVFIEKAYEFGVFYSLSLALFLGLLFASRQHARIGRVLAFPMARLFLIAFTALGMLSNTLFEERVVSFGFGVVFACLLAPQRVLEADRAPAPRQAQQRESAGDVATVSS